MAITYKKNMAVFEGAISVEDAEGLLTWLQKTPKARVDFSACTHLHASNLQVLMAAKLSVASWPLDNDLKTWLLSALRN
jgi:hypothetical protein